MNNVGRIYIVTIIDNKNYGNRLQNLATVYNFKKIGYSVFTLEILPYKFAPSNILAKLKKILKKIFFKKQEFDHRYAEREYNNEVFNDNVNLIKIRYFFKIFLRFKFKKNDIFFVGSDQVWNPVYFPKNYTFLLKFAKNIKGKFALSASFGVENFDNKSLRNYSKRLKKFKFISCRESSGVNLLKNDFNIESCLLSDPTLTLTKEEWLNFANFDVNLPNKKF